MGFHDWLDLFPLLRTRKALAAAQGKLEGARQEIRQLRERLQAATERLEAEKRKRRGLERRLARQRRRNRSAGRESRPGGARDASGRRTASVVSYPKSGRTWFSTLYFHYVRHHFGAPHLRQESLHMPDRNATFREFLAARARDAGFPICEFTHLGFSARKSLEGRPDRWPERARAALARPTILIVRDPRDVVVSHYHHLRAMEGALDPDPGLAAFVRGDWGIVRVVRFMNMWAWAVREKHPNLWLCAYESMQRDTAGTFAAALRFLGAPVDEASIERAVADARFEAMRDRERESRIFSGRSIEPDAFRFRRGTVGRHAEELKEPEIAYVNGIVRDHLDPVFASYRQRPAEQATAHRTR